MKTISIDVETRAAALQARFAARGHTNKACARPMPSWRDGGGDKILLGLLVLAGAVGLGYSFSCLVDLVQSCALFAARVGVPIQ